MSNNGSASDFFIIEAIMLMLLAFGFSLFSVNNNVSFVLGMMSITSGLLGIASAIKEYSKGTK